MAKDKKEKSAFEKLSPKHKEFFTNFLETRKAYKAYQKAYPNCTLETAYTNGSNLLKNAKIQAALNEYYKNFWDNKDDYIGKTLKNLIEMMDYDIDDFTDENGKIDLKKVKESNSYPVTEIKTKESQTKYGFTFDRSIKTVDKLKAADTVAKILGMIKEKVEHSVEIVVDLPERPKKINENKN